MTNNQSSVAVDPRAIFAQASQYHHCLELLRKSGNPQHIILPSIVMAAFAIELYLKCLICLETGKPGRGHKLEELFGKLGQATQDDLRKRWEIHIHEGKERLEALELSLGRLIPRDLDWALKAGSDTFAELRYLYEGEPKSEFILGSFTYILRSHILERTSSEP